MKKFINKRKSGALAHISSLPGKYGIGALGNSAREFIDFLKSAGQTLWQIMPLGPTGYGDSPYTCFSAFAGNTNFISLDELKSAGLLSSKNLAAAPNFPKEKVDYGTVINFHNNLLKIAFENFLKNKPEILLEEFNEFKNEQKFWLDDFAVFMTCKKINEQRAWIDWSKGKKHLNFSAKKIKKSTVEFYKFTQFLFYKQWFEIKKYANKAGIKIIGDMPIFVAYDSVDVWANPELFQLDQNGKMTRVAGVPPDYFSKTGQLWGNPLYDWKYCEKTNFKWWINRFDWLRKIVDIVRIDHFCGFCACWAVPAEHKTAEIGEWIKTPGDKLFSSLKSHFGNLPFIAEDLGVITDDVVELRDKFNFPGMKILVFAFGGDATNDFLPHNYSNNFVAYTGSHDTNTVNGWYETLDEKTKEQVKNYLNCDGENVAWDMIRAVLASVADTAIIPMQDILSLGGEAQMNFPGTAESNWQWRFAQEDLTSALAEKLGKLTEIYGRI